MMVTVIVTTYCLLAAPLNFFFFNLEGMTIVEIVPDFPLINLFLSQDNELIRKVNGNK